MSRNLTRRKDRVQYHRRSVNFKDPMRINGRNLLFDKLMQDLRSFGQLDVDDKVFVLKICKHKILENNGGGR